MNIENLREFTYVYWESNYMKDPFTYGGKTYATNGFILLRVEGELEGANDNPDFASKVELIEDNFQGEFDEPLLLKDFLSEEQTKQCPDCNGTGTVSVCPECDGEGELEYDSGWNTYTVECASCEGFGTLSDGKLGENCETCEGTGKVSVRTLVKVGTGSFDNRLLNKLISNLPPLTTVSPSKNPLKPAVLRWEGGEGLIMPVRA